VALHKAGAGNIDNYKECSFLLEGTGRFMGIDKVIPTLENHLKKFP
jgi:hypothetical protein